MMTVKTGARRGAQKQKTARIVDQLKLTLPAAFLEDLVDTLNELADDVEDAGYPARATSARRKAERLRKAIVKATPTKEKQ